MNEEFPQEDRWLIENIVECKAESYYEYDYNEIVINRKHSGM